MAVVLHHADICHMQSFQYVNTSKESTEEWELPDTKLKPAQRNPQKNESFLTQSWSQHKGIHRRMRASWHKAEASTKRSQEFYCPNMLSHLQLVCCSDLVAFMLCCINTYSDIHGISWNPRNYTRWTLSYLCVIGVICVSLVCHLCHLCVICVTCVFTGVVAFLVD